MDAWSQWIAMPPPDDFAAMAMAKGLLAQFRDTCTVEMLMQVLCGDNWDVALERIARPNRAEDEAAELRARYPNRIVNVHQIEPDGGGNPLMMIVVLYRKPNLFELAPRLGHRWLAHELEAECAQLPNGIDARALFEPALLYGKISETSRASLTAVPSTAGFDPFPPSTEAIAWTDPEEPKTVGKTVKRLLGRKA